MKRIKLLIDNGHGISTAGKLSPDGRLREFRWTRNCAALLVEELLKHGIDAELLVPEDADISIGERVSRANAWCDRLGAKNVLLVSIHNNAGSEENKKSLVEKDKYGWWKNSSGFEVYVSKNASTNSKTMARLLTAEAERRNLMGNRCVPPQKFWTWSWRTGDIGILARSKCPAVLTENLYQDNKQEVEYLLSDKGMNEIVQMHVSAILEYIKG